MKVLNYEYVETKEEFMEDFSEGSKRWKYARINVEVEDIKFPAVFELHQSFDAHFCDEYEYLPVVPVEFDKAINYMIAHHNREIELLKAIKF